MTNDLDLLGQFTRDHSQDAFAALVGRHVNLVYSVALRQVRSPQLAEEVAQSVFIDLARNAGKLNNPTGGTPILTAWLYQVTRRAAIDVVRRESRRQLREQIAVEMNTMNATASDWMGIEPLLDDAMAALEETDRGAVLLRYFENKSLREVGEALGTSDDTAQKRVSRAVERLREFFTKRGVTVGASGLVIVISANAVQAAPVGLAITISTAAALTGTAVSTSTVIATTKTVAMTTLQKALITTAVAVLAGTGIYEARQASTLRGQNQLLQQQQAPLMEQIRRLQQERDDATNQQALLAAETAKIKSHNLELLKLRDEVRLLREQLSQTKANPEQTTPHIKFDLPYSQRDEWSEKGTSKPLDTLFTMLAAIKRKDENRLNQIVYRMNASYTLEQLTLPKISWDTASAVQIVSCGEFVLLTENGPHDMAQIEAILEEPQTIDNGEMTTNQTVERWSLIKTNNQWLITGLH